MRAPRCVLFDLDGVLVRSEEVWFRLVEESGRQFRGSAVSRAEFAPTFGQGTRADVQVFNFQCTTQELDDFYAKNFERYSGEVWTNPEAWPLLTDLRQAGQKLAVVTNTATSLALKILSAAGLDTRFDVIACADQVARSKPAPDLIDHALNLLRLAPEEAWMVGDSRYDREAAEAARVFFVGLGIDGDLRIDSLQELAGQLERYQGP